MVLNEKFLQRFPKWVVTEIEPGFAHVQHNDPKTLNAFATEDWKAYAEILKFLDNDEGTNIILLSSTFDKAFSSGLNLREALELLAGQENWSLDAKIKNMHNLIREFQAAIAVPATMRTPTICLLNGVSYGLAIDIASACSIRIVTQDVKLSIREIKVGLVADMGSLQRMTNIVGNKSLMYQYSLTGEVFGAEDAMRIGFASRIVPDRKSGIEYAIELGTDINSNQQWVIKGTKDMIQHMVDGGHSETGLLKVADYNAVYLSGGVPDGGFSKSKL